MVAQLLAELAPIAEPPPPPAWPPGPGWWIVAAVVVLLALGLGLYLWRRHRRGAYRRQAQVELQALPDDAPAHAVLELLKRTARAACPAQARVIGGLYGGQFGRLLQAAVPVPEQAMALAQAADGAYAPQTRLDPDLRRSAAQWIRDHSPARIARAVPEAAPHA